MQPPDAPYGPGVRPGQLGDLHPETAEVASLVDQFADPHVIGGVPAGGQQDQAGLALRLKGRQLAPSLDYADLRSAIFGKSTSTSAALLK